MAKELVKCSIILLVVLTLVGEPTGVMGYNKSSVARNNLEDIRLDRQADIETIIIEGSDALSFSISEAEENEIVLEIEDVRAGIFKGDVFTDSLLIDRVTTKELDDDLIVTLSLLKPMSYLVSEYQGKVHVSVRDFGTEAELAEFDDLVVETATEPIKTAQATVDEIDAAQGATSTTRIRVLEAEEIYQMERPEKYVGKPISLDFKEIDILDVLRIIAEVSGFNVVVDPDVSGQMTIKLNNVPWDQALDVILKNQGLGKEITGNVMRIANVAKLRDEAILERQMQEAKQSAIPRESRVVYLSYANADTMGELLREGVLSERGRIIIDQRTNTMVLIDVPEYLDKALKLVKILDIQTKQVHINGQIITTAKDFNREFGIQWGGKFTADAYHGNTTGYRFPNNYAVDLEGGQEGGYAVNLPVGTQPLLGLTFGNVMDTLKLRMAISATESEGLTKIISNPRITTSDNQMAEIESGVQLPFSTRSSEGWVQTQFVAATLRLSVTPHITNDDFVSMYLEANKDSPDYARSGTFGGASGTPIITNRATTNVLVKDGDTIVIGGLNESTVGDSETRVPFLGKIPILGWLFKSRGIENQYSDLLIFITPTIVRHGNQEVLAEEF